MRKLNPIEQKEIYKIDQKIDKSNYLLVKYRLVPSSEYTLKEAAAYTCAITTLRTHSLLPFETQEERLKEMGYVLSVEDDGDVLIAYPKSLCSNEEGLTQLLVSFMYAVDYGYTEGYWVEDFELPEDFYNRYHGPRFGVDGMRQQFGVDRRPLLGVVLKPRLGATLDNISKAAFDCLVGGVDFIVDDHLLVDPDGEMAFEKRVPRLIDVVQRASLDSGEKKQYIVNISTSAIRAHRLAQLAQSEGAGALVVNAFAMGFGSLQDIIDDGINLPIISTNMGDGLLTRPNQPNGISSGVIAKICRLAGVDGIHCGTSSSECYGPEAFGPAIIALRSGLGSNIKGSFAVAEGDVTIADVWDNIYSLGPDLMLEVCSGILNYPVGVLRGARAFRTLVNNLSYKLHPSEAHDRIMEISGKDSDVKIGLEHYGYQPKLKL